MNPRLTLLCNQAVRAMEGWLAIPRDGDACVLWSGGKDSMVMLHLMRHLAQIRLPVVLFREPWFPEKYRFHDQVIADWGLECYSPWPVGTWAYQHRRGMVLGARYQMRGGDAMDVPKDVLEYTAIDRDEAPVALPKSYLCGQDFLKRPRAHGECPWALAFIGHKDCDVDPVLGRIPLRESYLDRPDGTSLAYPLRHWTDRDVWDYLEHWDVPMDTARYAVNERRNRDDKTMNADWLPACTRCLTKGITETVHCPKLNRPIDGVAQHVVWAEGLTRWNFEAEGQAHG